MHAKTFAQVSGALQVERQYQCYSKEEAVAGTSALLLLALSHRSALVGGALVLVHSYV